MDAPMGLDPQEKAPLLKEDGPESFYVGTVVTGSPETDREVLVHLYETTGGKSWKKNNGWAEKAADLGTWWGVTTNAEGRVTELDLSGSYRSGNDLVGTIPEELGKLAALQVLDLGNNKLNGAIPEELGKLAALQVLDLGNNKLNGGIPKELGNLLSLHSLNLHGNELDGYIPDVLSGLHALQVLKLFANKLTGFSSQTEATGVSLRRVPDM